MPAKQPRTYRALTGVTWMADSDEIRRVRAGEHIPHSERAWGRAEAGDILPADVPRAALESMLEQGSIEEVSDG